MLFMLRWKREKCFSLFAAAYSTFLIDSSVKKARQKTNYYKKIVSELKEVAKILVSKQWETRKKFSSVWKIRTDKQNVIWNLTIVVLSTMMGIWQQLHRALYWVFDYSCTWYSDEYLTIATYGTKMDIWL